MVIGNQLIDLVLDWLASQDLLLQLRIQVVLRSQIVLPKLGVMMADTSVIICGGSSITYLFFFVVLMVSNRLRWHMYALIS